VLAAFGYLLQVAPTASVATIVGALLWTAPTGNRHNNKWRVGCLTFNSSGSAEKFG